ncbi:ABC transporter ATP-binding protein [Paenibacillus tyrfis]|uniref:ABC transporter ATP-binding protein n=1 Tax=Paenibacillus tyrfis TaxID=1501230 RepID=UPI000B58F6E4|nr:ABC transporter ATP-binding protein [Paenibacillus tyrfis]
MPAIELTNVSKVYGNHKNKFTALNNINLTVEQGEFVAIVGPSGSGKTTLLNIMGCMDSPTRGECKIMDRSTTGLKDSQLIHIRNRVVSFIFQHYALLNNYSVYDNVTLPFAERKMSKHEKKEKAKQYLSKLGIEDLFHKKVKNLSGGQKQRVAIARALASEAEIIFADEPTGALDSTNADKLMEILCTLNNEGKTIIVITHDSHVASFANRKLFMKDGTITFDEPAIARKEA